MTVAGLALAVGGGLSAAAFGGPLTALVTTGTTTVPTGTTPTTTTEPTPMLIAPGVTIAGIHVGELTPSDAYALVSSEFARPLVLRVRTRRFAPPPARVGASADIRRAVARARRAAPGTRVGLAVSVNRARLRAYVAGIARRFDRAPVDARLTLRNLRPFITPDRPGRALDRLRSGRAIVRTLARYRRGPVSLPVRSVAASVRKRDFGPIVVIRRGSKRLFLYRGTRFVRAFGVATGQSSYPTPLGRFEIVVKWRNPWWYPPDSDWARGQAPVPPGPGNPLGTRWMGLSAPGVGIHGTPNAASIGYSASHGCIRMRIPEAEWLFVRVEIGTPVFIVAA